MTRVAPFDAPEEFGGERRRAEGIARELAIGEKDQVAGRGGRGDGRSLAGHAPHEKGEALPASVGDQVVARFRQLGKGVAQRDEARQ